MIVPDTISADYTLRPSELASALASRFVHLEIRVDAEDWCAWAAVNGIAAEVIFFVQLEPTLLHHFDPQSRERAFACPRTWHFVSNIVQRRNGLDPAAERALFRGAIGEAAAVVFAAFLKVWRELPHPRAVINDPENADIPENASACADGALRLALPPRQRHQFRLHRHLRHGAAARGRRVPRQVLRAPRARVAALASLHPLGRRQDAMTEDPMIWQFIHYPARDAPSRDYAVRAPTLNAAKRTLAATLNVPVWTLRYPCTACMSRDRRRRLSPSTREAKFGTGRGVRMTKRALLAIRCRRRNCCSALQASQRSRAASLNAPGCQPMSASQVEPTSAMWRKPLPNTP